MSCLNLPDINIGNFGSIQMVLPCVCISAHEIGQGREAIHFHKPTPYNHTMRITPRASRTCYFTHDPGVWGPAEKGD